VVHDLESVKSAGTRIWRARRADGRADPLPKPGFSLVLDGRVPWHRAGSLQDGRMTIDDRTDDGMHFVLSGELVFERQPELDGYLDEFRRSDVASLTLDLGGVTFIDSTGLRVLFGLLALAEQRGGRIRLLSVSAPVRRTLELVGASDLIDAATASGPPGSGG
jgi:anti-anti-sigma factor